MFDCGYKSQCIGGQRKKFVRLEELNSTVSMASSAGGAKRHGFSFEGFGFTSRAKKNPSKSFRKQVKRGSERLLTFGQALRSGVTCTVFPQDRRGCNHCWTEMYTLIESQPFMNTHPVFIPRRY